MQFIISHPDEGIIFLDDEFLEWFGCCSTWRWGSTTKATWSKIEMAQIRRLPLGRKIGIVKFRPLYSWFQFAWIIIQ